MNAPARRACARIAWRHARRAPGRSALVMAMVALPIFALVAASTIIATAVTTPEESARGQLGRAAFGFYASEEQARAAERALPAGAELVLERRWDVYLGQEPGVTGRWQDQVAMLEYSVRPDAGVLDGIHHVLTGRMPRAAGEVALQPAVAERLGVVPGDDVALGGMTLRVTGTVVRTLQYSMPVAIVGPGTGLPSGGPRGFVRGLVGLEPGLDGEAVAERLRPVSGDIETRSSWSSFREGSRTFATMAAFAVTVLALLATCLIVAAAFVVGIRRQLRALGLVAAAGGEREHVRAVVVSGGTVLGVVASSLGAALGLVAARLAHPSLYRVTDTVPGPVAVNWVAVAGAVALGTIAATLAAAIPARAANRMPVMAALAGRSPRPRPPGRAAWLGAGIFAVGIPLAATGTRSDQQGLFTVGVGALVGGLLLAIPLLVTALGRAARFLPGVWRIAARDAARQGRRTAAALAAATLALTAGVTTLAAAAGDAEGARLRRSMGDNHVLVQPEARQRAAIRADLAAAFPEGTVVTLRRLALDDRRRHYVSLEGAIDPRWKAELRYAGSPFLGTPEVLRALGASAGADELARGRLLALGRGTTIDGTVRMLDDDRPDPRPTARVIPAVEVDAPVHAGPELPMFLASREGARALGLRPADVQGILLALPQALTEADIERAQDVVGARANVRTAFDWVPTTVAVRIPAAAGSALLALAIVGVALALVNAEARRDRAILTAVGASPGTRRKIAAANAVLLTLVAGVIALPAGFVPYAVTQTARIDGYPVVAPWDAALAVLVLVPALAGLGAFALSRAPRGRMMLDPLT